jgi:predicted hydrolase (HD superfamily)
MRYMARKQGKNEAIWVVVGLIHDLDYECFPQRHCQKPAEILRERGWPDQYIRAILSHG